MRARLRVATSPESASCSPASTASSVDFPAPFGPIRPMRSPSDTGKLISSNNGTAPNRFDRPCAFRIGGIQPVYRANNNLTPIHTDETDQKPKIYSQD